MKRAHAAQGRHKRRSTVGVSLFPFLAVLMCTMGSLVLLLVVINRQGRLQAAEAARGLHSKAAQKKEDLQAARELVQLQISQLKTSREKTEQQLTEARLQLGHLEDHLRRLREQFASLQAAGAELDNLKDSTGQQRQQLQAELDRLKTAINETQKQLAEAQQTAKSQPKSYAIIPYEGSNGTHRRPIYLECREDAVIFQPEGVSFIDSDFDGPLGPGNPLDAALRAIREYLLSKQAIAVDGSNEPYPLLLVRPRGIPAYYAARAAMTSWASEFGYELIDEDWPLKFEPPDPQLAALVRQTVDAARGRQQRLAQIAPRFYSGDSSSSSSSRPVYRATPTRGGVVIDGETSSAASDAIAEQKRPSRTFGSAFGSGKESAPSAASADREGVVRKPNSTQQPAQPQPGQTATALRPGEWIPYERPPKPIRDPRKPDEKKSDEKKPDRDRLDEKSRDDNVRSLAESRGNNWGLPDASSRSVPVTRPIRIQCDADRLVLTPERGPGEGKEIPLKASTQDSVDEFVSAVWDRMDSWGIAGRGMYWKPVLKVQVAPGGEDRLRDLQILLQGSGLDVQAADSLEQPLSNRR